MGERQIPLAEVAATLIICKGRVLAVYNRNWNSFTLPMTKRRKAEGWEDAAARAAAECLGAAWSGKPEFCVDIGELQISGRDGELKHYHFQVFSVQVPPEIMLAPSAPVQWLTPDDLVDESRRAITMTAPGLIKQVQAECVREGKGLPWNTANG